jgi:hypothetical protein
MGRGRDGCCCLVSRAREFRYNHAALAGARCRHSASEHPIRLGHATMSLRIAGLVLGVAAGSLAALAPFEAYGQSQVGRFELTPYAGYRFGGTLEDEDGSASVQFEDHGSAGLILNVREGAYTQWEIIYSRQETSADTSTVTGLIPSTDVEVHYFQAGGTYQGDGRTARPFVALTLGGAHLSPQSPGLDSDTFWSFSIGGGLQLRPSARLGIRLEARAWGTLLNSDSRLFCTSGPEAAFCAFQINGDVMWQVETFAGAVFRF